MAETTANSNACVHIRLADNLSPEPILAANMVAVPMPNPIAMFINTKVTGNVKLTAASSFAPIKPIKKVSTRLNSSMAMIPRIMGSVILRNVGMTGA